MRDPYSVLGVKRDAAADEIKAAWRSKAKSVHPDHNQDDPNATGRFAEIGQAYEVLKDPDRRRRYDTAADMHQTIMQQRESARAAEERAKVARAKAEQVMEELARANAQRAQAQAASAQAKSHANAQPQAKAQPKTQASAQQSYTQQSHAQSRGRPHAAAQSAAYAHDIDDAAEAEAPEDMIERIFGSGDEAEDAARERQQNQKAAQAEAQRQAKSQAQQQQAQANSQAAPDETDAAVEDAATRTDAAPKPPLPLQAVDLIASLVRRIRGTAPPPEKAPDLTAEAVVTIEDLIARDSATVHLADEREVRFALEAGMTDGHVVRLKGQGLKMPPAARGDLIVTLRVARHERFRIEGFDLHTVLPISLEDAVLGTEAEIETPGGKVPITVPAWSGSDRSITIEGLGLADGAGGRGAMVVELRVVLWEKPDEKVTDLMKHMRHGLYI